MATFGSLPLLVRRMAVFCMHPWGVGAIRCSRPAPRPSLSGRSFTHNVLRSLVRTTGLRGHAEAALGDGRASALAHFCAGDAAQLASWTHDGGNSSPAKGLRRQRGQLGHGWYVCYQCKQRRLLTRGQRKRMFCCVACKLRAFRSKMPKKPRRKTCRECKKHASAAHFATFEDVREVCF